MVITKTSAYNKTLKKVIIDRHLNKENERIELIEKLIILSENMKELMLNPLSKVYNINKKKGNLKEIYTANINSKLRLYIQPIGEYPYNLVKIDSVQFLKIDKQHYGDG